MTAASASVIDAESTKVNDMETEKARNIVAPTFSIAI